MTGAPSRVHPNRAKPGRFGRRAIWLAAVLAAAAGLFPCSAAARTAVVAAERLNVRPTPGIERPPIAVLGRGTRVRAVRDLGDWLEIDFDDRTGFVRHRERYIRLLPAGGGTESTEEEARSRQKAETLAEEIQKGEAALAEVSRKEAAVIDRLDDADRALARLRRQTGRLRRELASMAGRIAENRDETDALKEEIARLETDAAARLTAYYKLQWLGSLNLLASADSLGELVQRKTALETILAWDEALWDRLANRQKRLETTLAALEERKNRKLAMEAELEERITQMGREKGRRKELLVRIRQDKTLQRAAVAALKDAAAELAQTVEGLRPLPREAPPLQGRAFAERKGLLPLPVRGKIVNRFGRYRNPRFNVVNFRSGVDIRADRGEPIHAVCGGTVLYADWFKGYGNMIIIDHGSFFYTVYAHAEELFKEKGAGVDAGEVIATVGDTGSMIGPSLYFEIRHHGKPLDPADWLELG